MTWKDDEAMLRARWEELQGERAKIMDVLTPLREARDAYVKETTEKLAGMSAGIKDAQGNLFEIENERARTARMLGAKSLRVR